MAILLPAYDGLPSAIERLWATATLYAMIGAYPPTIILGIPAYFMARRHLSARPVNCAVAGALVAALPWIAIILTGPTATSANIGGRATVIDGHYTEFGWWTNASSVGMIALAGMVGGLVFWLVAAAGHKTTGENRAAASPGA